MTTNYGKTVMVIMLVLLLINPALSVPIFNADGYEMKYKDYNPTHIQSYDDVTGSVIVRIRAGGSAEDLLVFVSRDGTNVSPFDSRYNPDRTDIVGQNPGYLRIKVLPSGESKPERLMPGNYTAYLRNGNAGQMEKQSFVIDAKQVSYVSLLGHAVSSKGFRFDKLDIVKAIWGNLENCTTTFYPEVNHTVHHNGTSHNVTIVDKEAWDEYIYHPEVNHTVVHPAETHNVTIVDKEAWDEYIYHPEVNHTVFHPEVNHTVFHPEVNHTVFHPEVNHTIVHDNTTSQVWVPEVNHTEKQISTWQITKPAIPATNATGRLAELVCVKYIMNFCVDYDYEVGHVHARINGNPSQTDFYYDNDPYHITGNKHDDAFIVSPGTPEIPAEYGCVASTWEDGYCPANSLDTCTEKKCGCVQRIIVDSEGYFTTVDNMDGYTEIVVDAKEYYEIIVDAKEYYEIVVDAKEYYEIVVDAKEYTEVIHHPAETHEETIVDKEPWTEIVVDVKAYTEVIHHPAETHEETIIDTEPWDEVVVDIPAHSVTVCIDDTHIDVTSIVKDKVKNGELHISHEDYVELFGTIENKAPKFLTVTYEMNGITGTKTVSEFEDMNIP